MLHPYDAHTIDILRQEHVSYRLLHTFVPEVWPCSPRSLLPRGGESTLVALVSLFCPDVGLAVQERSYLAPHFIFA